MSVLAGNGCRIQTLTVKVTLIVLIQVALQVALPVVVVPVVGLDRQVILLVTVKMKTPLVLPNLQLPGTCVLKIQNQIIKYWKILTQIHLTWHPQPKIKLVWQTQQLIVIY